MSLTQNNDLKALKCEVCRVGAPTVTEEEIDTLKPEIPEWTIVEENNIKKLTRKLTFKNFEETLACVNKIGSIAEEEGHHPVMLVEYNCITIWWWSHKIKGLHRNDFIMAAKVDNIEK